MKIPKYMKAKILKRATLQGKANSLQQDIEEWCMKHSIELDYEISHICLYTEPMMVALRTIKKIEED